MRLQIYLLRFTVLLCTCAVLQIYSENDVTVGRRSEGDIIEVYNKQDCIFFKYAIYNDTNGVCSCPRSHSTFHYADPILRCFSNVELGGKSCTEYVYK